MAANATAAAPPIQPRNFIDDEIFNKLASAKVQPARLSTDEEFFRRINLDLTRAHPFAGRCAGLCCEHGRRQARCRNRAAALFRPV